MRAELFIRAEGWIHRQTDRQRHDEANSSIFHYFVKAPKNEISTQFLRLKTKHKHFVFFKFVAELKLPKLHSVWSFSPSSSTARYVSDTESQRMPVRHQTANILNLIHFCVQVKPCNPQFHHFGRRLPPIRMPFAPYDLHPC